MLDFIEVVVVRTMFVLFLVAFFLFGFGSLIGYPGPFVLISFSIGGLPMAAYIDRAQRWWVALLIAAVTCVIPLYLLSSDFSVPSLTIHMFVLGGLAYGLAWIGLVFGRFVWKP